MGPTSPKFYYYQKSENSSHHVEMVIVSSNDTICMTFSIQTLYVRKFQLYHGLVNTKPKTRTLQQCMSGPSSFEMLWPMFTSP